MRLREIFNRVFFLDALADVFHAQIMRHSIVRRVELGEGHLEVVRHLVDISHAETAPVLNVARGAHALVKTGVVAPPLRRGDDLLWQALEDNLQNISSTVFVRGRFKFRAIVQRI